MKSKKAIVIAVVVCCILIGIGIFVFFATQKDSYRVIKIYEFDGTATVSRENMGEISMYPNMVLQSGDEVYFEEGLLTLKLDEDKYVYVEEKTRFVLTASGTEASGKTSIELKEGAITNEIRSPLADNASYEVHTQNSSMSVRGTVFRVEVYFDAEGVLYTRVSVFGGKVETHLVFSDGTKADPRMVEYGKETIIYENDVDTDYLEGITDIQYETLTKAALKVLSNLVKEGLSLEILPEELVGLIMEEDSSEEKSENEEQKDSTKESDDADNAEEDNETEDENIDTSKDPDDESIDDSTEDSPPAPSASRNTYTVTFVYDGVTFATQSVAEGGHATEPSLMPAKEGEWEFDFSTAITKNITVYWK